MSKYFYILFVLSVLLNIYLFYNIQSVKKCINRVSSILREIRIDNSSRRIHIGAKSHQLDKLGVELNLFMDKYSDTIEKKQTLESAHKKLIANISHDIRTPLTSLLGYVEVLQKDEAIDSEERKKFMDIIEKKTQSLHKLLNEFFELSKLESEDTFIRFEKNNLSEIIKGVLAAFYPEFVKKQISPEIKIPDNPLFVWGDGTSIERVLQNLISNALKFGRDGGLFGIGLRQEQEKVWVDIWNDGKGIPEADIRYIFDRLYTTELSRNKNLQGSGLGLAIVKKLIEKQKGEITAISEPDKRTVFSFSLLLYL
jgi:signal transduction histidine kinase